METETEKKIDKRTKAYKDSVIAEEPEYKYIKDQFAKAKDNPGFKICMHCGAELEPNEDGSPKFRKYPEPCYECTWREK
jgi:hypothetical protein